MPSDVEHGSTETSSLLGRSRHNMKRFFDGFVDFAFQGNILQIAFGLMFVPFLLLLPPSAVFPGCAFPDIIKL